MKLGIFSDIHGNLYAFEKIYRELKSAKCDLYLFLGDVCGYYYQQNEIIAMLLDLPNLHAVAGNHDVLFLAALKDKKVMQMYTDNFGRSFELLAESISPAARGFLEKLPASYEFREPTGACFHGSPLNPLTEYIYPDSSLTGFANLPYMLVFLGHTHYSMDVSLGQTRFINPGSVGQPRNGCPPSYAIYDTETNHVQFHSVFYDIKPLVTDIKKNEEKKSYLIDVLRRMKK